MRAFVVVPLLALLLVACGSQPGGNSTTTSSSTGGVGGAGGGAGGAPEGGGGGGTGGSSGYGPCSVDGVAGECITVSACAALPDHASTPGFCPGPADIQCCTEGPSVADNPPIPAGYKLMMQADVTTEMTTWAIDILHDPAQYPMFSTTTKTFGTLDVLARVEWHPPDFQNQKVHRGVTLYEPI